MLRWGLVTTVKAPEEQILAFVAHHLFLGADQLFLFFDDPDDPAYDRIAALPKVVAIRCTADYWEKRGGRHDRHQNRQARNAREAQGLCDLDWLGHIDVDEFLHPARQVAAILADQPRDQVALRMEPFEAVHTPGLADDIFTARHFRGPIGLRVGELRRLVLEGYESLLPKGHLSHTVGKSFCRPKARGVVLRLHLVVRDKQRLDIPLHPELRVLHFHAQDYDAWMRALPFRLSRGAYQYSPMLQAHLVTATESERRHLYETTQMLTEAKRIALQAQGRLITADLGLRDKVAALPSAAP